MKKYLLTTALAAGLASSLPAHAQTASCTTDSSGNMVCDPTSFHVGPNATGGPGTSPNLIASGTTFFIKDVDNSPNSMINEPITIYFAVPDGKTGAAGAAPTVTQVLYNGTMTTWALGSIVAPSLSPDVDYVPGNGSGQDLNSFDGCTGCNASINATNLMGYAGQPAELALLGYTPAGYDVYSIAVGAAPASLVNGEYIQVTGTFGLGTVIAPLAEDVITTTNPHNGHTTTTTTWYDTSWTNAGLITSGSGSGGGGGAIPEPSTWAMMLLGFAGLGFAGWRKGKGVRTAFSGA